MVWAYALKLTAQAFSLNQACKPSSVPRHCAWAATIHLGRRLPGVSSDQPGSREEPSLNGRRPLRPLLGLAPGGVYRGQTITRLPVSSCLTISPLPGQTGRRRYVSVALSLRSPSLGVTQHPGSLELGLSSCGTAARGRPAWLRQLTAYHHLHRRSMTAKDGGVPGTCGALQGRTAAMMLQRQGPSQNSGPPQRRSIIGTAVRNGVWEFGYLACPRPGNHAP
jgi:hypothetical protein